MLPLSALISTTLGGLWLSLADYPNSFSTSSSLCQPAFPTILQPPIPVYFYFLSKLLFPLKYSLQETWEVNKASKAQKYMKLTRVRELLICQALPQGYTSGGTQGYLSISNCLGEEAPSVELPGMCFWEHQECSFLLSSSPIPSEFFNGVATFESSMLPQVNFYPFFSNPISVLVH